MTDKASATPRALRCVISIVGRRNAGKSSLINALTGQEVAIVSDIAGTTTDAVAKPYELLPLGPVTFYDTAGLDDEGELGALRIKATHRILCRSDLALVVCGKDGLQPAEKNIISQLQKIKLPFVVVFNKNDVSQPLQADIDFCAENKIVWTAVSAAKGQNIEILKKTIIEAVPAEFKKDPLLAGDLVESGDTVIMVVPIDLSAPKGRLILPQVQVLRELLDCNAVAVAVKENQLRQTLDNLKNKPALVITDSQVVQQVAKIVPENIKLTTFSILFARNKGNLSIMVEGARTIDKLRDGDKILIAEACSHHILSDDIGKVKIPAWISKYTGKQLQFEFCQGNDFPENLEDYALVIHCGACMLNRVEMMRRLNECVRRGVPITNYGVAISKTQGVLDRTVAPLGL